MEECGFQCLNSSKLIAIAAFFGYHKSNARTGMDISSNSNIFQFEQVSLKTLMTDI